MMHAHPSLLDTFEEMYLSDLPLYKSVLMFSPNATTATPGERTSAFRE